MFIDSPVCSSSSSSSGSAWRPARNGRSSPVHVASLVDAATHAPALMQLIDVKLDGNLIQYVVDCVTATVDHALGRPSGRVGPYTQRFIRFVSTVLFRAEVTTPTVLTALVYIHRAGPHVYIALEEWARERIFLGALIVASKYTNDSTLKNVHWALCTGVFGKRDVGRIEREFLDVLDWQLGVSEGDLLTHHGGVFAASAQSSCGSVNTSVPQHTRQLSPSVPESPSSSPQSMSLHPTSEMDVNLNAH
ncbi:hypothetical protein C8R46DRAFT_900492 [Mycena filopes]|nr:hypothetical protein C8R46DRAFT_900492 [Mycena filopes]